MGRVAHVVAPNLYHHLSAGDVKTHYPQAELTVPPGLVKKRKDLEPHFTLGEQAPPWANEITPVQLVGSPTGEWVFLHADSASLICSDMVQNVRECHHGPTRLYLRLSGLGEKPGLSGLLRWVYKKSPEARAALDQILERPFERIVLCHGSPIQVDARDALREAYAWL
jgi:hypothetical protein